MQKLSAALPPALDATVFLVIHVSADGPRLMDSILNHSGSLRASYPKDGQRFERGQIYVAPPDHHLLLEGDHMRVIRSVKEHWTRPAIDPLFRSAALHHGARVIGVVLSGYLSDGAMGLRAIKAGGGLAVVQHPGDAAVPWMPINALKQVDVDYCLPLNEIALLLERLILTTAPTVESNPTVDQKSLETLGFEALASRSLARAA